MFIVQPLLKFGDVLCEQMDSIESGFRRWRLFEFAVAWLNQRGADRIRDSAARFLDERSVIRATVGLDFSSTSYEGLSVLLALESGTRDITTHVFFDENRACTFHPKVFLFSNGKESNLIVGSNNMTGGGLDTNIEAALGITAPMSDDTIQAATQTLAAWRNEAAEPRTRRLTQPLLEELRDAGYVRTEAEIRAAYQSQSGNRSTVREPLFGRSQTRSAINRDQSGGTGAVGVRAPSVGSAEVLLMRVRPRRTGTQVQISMQVHQGSFMNGATEVLSAADGSRRPIGYDHTRRGGRRVPNLARFEAPEMAGMTNPVARFRWVEDVEPNSAEQRQLQYEVFDADSDDVGRQILTSLRATISSPPNTNLSELNRTTAVVSKRDLAIAQWYRLDLM